MPHHPSEEHAPGGLTDKVAQESKDMQTSDHPMHDENKGPVEQPSKGATTKDFHSKGPQIPDGDLPAPKSRQELDAEAKKLNG